MPGESHRRRRGSSPRSRSRETAGHDGGGSRQVSDLEQGLTFGIAATLVVVLALQDGGYDIVLRQEFFLIIWWSLALGLAFRVLPRAQIPPGNLWVIGGVVGLVVTGLASLAWTPSDERAVEETARVAGYAGVVVLGWMTLNRGTWRAAAFGLLVAAVVICVVALGSRLSPNLLPLDPIERALETPRLFKPLGYWNAVAAMAASATVMLLAWSADSRRSRARAAALAFSPLCLLALYLTYSRGGVVELAIGSIVVLALCRNRARALAHLLMLGGVTALLIWIVDGYPEIAQGSGYAGAPWVATACLLAVGVCCAIGRATKGLGSSQDLICTSRRARKGKLSNGATVFAAVGLLGLASLAAFAGNDGLATGDNSAAVFSDDDPAGRLTTTSGNRSAYWSEALRAFADEPLIGSGPGTFQYGWARHGSEAEAVVDAHSLPLEVLAERGLLGGISLAAALFGLVIAGLRGLLAAHHDPAASSLAAAFVVYLVAASVDWMWEVTAVTVLGLGAVVVLGAASIEARRGRRRRPKSYRLGLAGVALACGIVQIPGIVSTQRTRDAYDLLASGQAEAASDEAQDAVTAAPWAASPYVARAEVALQRGRLNEARESAITAVQHEPKEPDHRVLLAQIEAEAGNEATAQRQVEIAQILAPNAADEFQEDLDSVND